MKLNPDCIRDILLTVENETNFNNYLEYEKSTYSKFKLLAKYNHDEIIYHISQCDKSHLIDDVEYYEVGDFIIIKDLSPEGHKFLADIRSDTVWKHVKNISKDIGVSSLSALTQIATGVVTTIIKSHLGLT